MLKKLLLPFLLFCTVATSAQLNNNWIDYSKTYYKFTLGEDNLYRIPQVALAAAGLGTVNADHFQLWRNGQEVRVFTPVVAAPLGVLDYIEFFGEMNDGKADKPLYKNPQFQLADRYSLETDTAAYFLTVNPASVNLRYANFTNPAPAPGVVADAYFFRKIDLFYKNQYNRGDARDFGTYVYSSTYDNGEGPVSQTISANSQSSGSPAVPTTFTETINGLNVYYGGPNNGLSIRTKVFFNTANSSRSLSLKVGSLPSIAPTLPSSNPNMASAGLTSLNIIANNLNTLTYLPNANTFSLSYLLTNTNQPASGGYSPPIENMVIASLGITYPATFNFNNTTSFAFDLGASSTGNFLVIDNFNYGAVAPILYDINNGRRYIGDITSTSGKVKFLLPASAEPTRRFILNSLTPSTIKIIPTVVTKTFVNYNAAANRGDYIIISHPRLYNDGSGVNNVELYRAYRSTTNGGGYNAKIVDINELTDQFAFGIKSHPAAVRDFTRYMDANYSIKPKAIFIIGRGISYYDKKVQETNIATYPANAAIIDKLDFIPTFGWPPSDIMLVSKPGFITPITPIGRLGAINGTEVGYYYQKVLQYEQNQRTQSPFIADKAWMKNTIQIVGGQNVSEANTFGTYMNGYAEDWIKDTLFGGNAEQFVKTSSTTIQQASSNRISQNFADGLGFVKYFGHSSSTSFEFNLSDPDVYNNSGKYPFFSVSGCTAGNYYNFDPFRLTSPATLSEKYVLANQKGSIAFLADTHFGLPGYLDYYNKNFHENFCRIAYGQTVGSQIKNVVSALGGDDGTLEFNTRIHIEEINLHGDPALKINNFPKPDYAIEPQLVKVSPSIITVSDQSFKVKAIWRNLGKATNDSIKVSIKRTLSSGVVETIKDTLIFATRYMDSLEVTVPISPLKDKGNNKICVEVDNTNKVNELYESNNKACADFFIFEATLTPIFPYNYSIVNTQNITYSASTANPLLPVTSNYILEIDTTALFNSPFKKGYNKTGLGGLIEFTPTNITFTDSTVYYWRTAVIPATGNTIWNMSSFVYLPASTSGYNVSHYFQYEKNSYKNITLGNDRRFRFTAKSFQFTLKTAQFPSSGQLIDFSLSNSSVVQQAGLYAPLSQNRNAIRFNIIDSATLVPWYNDTTAAGVGQYGSTSTLPINQFTVRGFYQFDVSTPAARQVARNFLNIVPNGNTVVMANSSNGLVSGNTPITWATDPGANLYQALKGLGFSSIDLVTDSVPFGFVGKKGSINAIAQNVGLLPTDKLTINFGLEGISTDGEITSDVLGPVKKWNALHWKVFGLEAAPNDKTSIQIIGLNVNGSEDLLTTVTNALDTSIAWINANTYPNLKLRLLTKDSITITPSQIKYLTLNADLLPEGAIAPSVLYSMRDTVEAGEPIQFTLAFKNVSKSNFSDSMQIGLTIRTNNNFDSIINISKGKILMIGDTLKATYTIPSQSYLGNNTLVVDFNLNNAQPEQFHFNNILYKNFYVRGDEIHPLLDVTFDGIHILNKDIVSSKPNILIKLKDENRFLALRDTSLLKVQIKYPGENSFRNFRFDADTMRFTPANMATGENTAVINLKPFLKKDGDYELLVTGKDVTGNDAGVLSYRSTFTVLNKPMISEMLNYPNPFTTSTAFVFTLTGSEVPQNIRIQILTISGKVIKEITKTELGNIHIGRNITDYKWDGTDSYNQQVGNGVYLYRVITNLNGKSLDKYKAEGDDSGKYFNKGYGKMYLMR